MYNQRVREATIRYAMSPHISATARPSVFSNVIKEHFTRRSLALRAQCGRWSKQLRRSIRVASTKPTVGCTPGRVFAGGVSTSTPDSLKRASDTLFAQLDTLVAARVAERKAARAAAAQASEPVEIE